jgi:hypothetical protein
MQPEYDFSRAERGKFYRQDVTFNTILGDMCMISIARTVSWSSILQSKIGNL